MDANDGKQDTNEDGKGTALKARQVIKRSGKVQAFHSAKIEARIRSKCAQLKGVKVRLIFDKVVSDLGKSTNIVWLKPWTQSMYCFDFLGKTNPISTSQLDRMVAEAAI